MLKTSIFESLSSLVGQTLAVVTKQCQISTEQHQAEMLKLRTYVAVVKLTVRSCEGDWPAAAPLVPLAAVSWKVRKMAKRSGLRKSLRTMLTRKKLSEMSLMRRRGADSGSYMLAQILPISNASSYQVQCKALVSVVYFKKVAFRWSFVSPSRP